MSKKGESGRVQSQMIAKPIQKGMLVNERAKKNLPLPAAGAVLEAVSWDAPCADLRLDRRGAIVSREATNNDGDGCAARPGK